jgi:hypothetical protein
MANIYGGTTWTIDTAGVICTYPVYVKTIKVIGEGAAGGENFLIVDPVTGKPLWDWAAPVGMFVGNDPIEKTWINGFQVSAIGLTAARLMVDLG